MCSFNGVFTRLRPDETGSQKLSGLQREDLSSGFPHARLKPTYSVTEISSVEC